MTYVRKTFVLGTAPPIDAAALNDIELALVDLDTTQAAQDVSVAALQAAQIPDTLLDVKGDLIVASAADTPARLPAGTDGYVLESRAAEVTGLKWVAPASGGVLLTVADQVGDLLVGSGSDTVDNLAPGTDGQILEARSTETLGLKWVAAVTAYPSDGWTDDTSETWTWASADTPTYTFTISGDKTTKYAAGQRLKLTNGGTVKYFIITAVSYGAPNTTVTIYGGTDYTLANSAITLNYHSREKAPFGFPLSPLKWTVEVTDVTLRTKLTPVDATWYNLNAAHTISVPVGVWGVEYEAAISADDNVASVAVFCTLSTGAATESDAQMTSFAFIQATGATRAVPAISVYRRTIVSVAAKTPYYLNLKTNAAGVESVDLYNSVSPLIIRAVCAYL